MQPKAVAQTRTTSFSPVLRAALLGVMALSLVILQTVMAYAKPESLAPLAEKISPSVVNITTSTLVEGRTGPQGIVPEGSPFEDFFREFQDRNRGEGDETTPAPRRSSALGSGFVISEDGYVVTNNHVIEGIPRTQHLIIASHFSTRYSAANVRKYVTRALPDLMEGRLHLWI